jgi:hypothetical protein
MTTRNITVLGRGTNALQCAATVYVNGNLVHQGSIYTASTNGILFTFDADVPDIDQAEMLTINDNNARELTLRTQSFEITAVTGDLIVDIVQSPALSSADSPLVIDPANFAWPDNLPPEPIPPAVTDPKYDGAINGVAITITRGIGDTGSYPFTVTQGNKLTFKADACAVFNV